ncbi:MAG TPA: hypothetical protein QF870_01915 [Nitrospinota bacterium]|nr:hypothetical protein [Nitrospinota bacterium]
MTWNSGSSRGGYSGSGARGSPRQTQTIPYRSRVLYRVRHAFFGMGCPDGIEGILVHRPSMSYD